MHAGFALQKAVFAALGGDAALAALVGGRIHDAAPRSPEFPYLTLAETAVRDWSAGAEPGAEHRLTVHIWSRGAGKRQAFEIADRVGWVLHDQRLTLDGHRLVNLRHEFTEVRRDPDGLTWHGVLRFRAATEPV